MVFGWNMQQSNHISNFPNILCLTDHHDYVLVQSD